MKLKVYSQANCKYCENIKKTLEENKYEFEMVEIDDNRAESQPTSNTTYPTR